MHHCSKRNSRNFVQSVARGLSFLQALGNVSRPLSLTQLARSVGTNKATASRFCYTLTVLGFMQQDTQKRYHLTPRVLTLGYSAVRGLNWRKVASHYLESLSQAIGEWVNLSVLDGHEILYMIRIRTENILPYDLQIGSKLPVHCTSMGKVLMAFGPPEKTRPILEALEFRPFTHRTITQLEDYLKELEKVRHNGYAFNDEEQSEGLRSVAAPVRALEKWAVAAINIAVPTKRYNRSDVERVLAPRAVQTAEAISKAFKEMEWDGEILM